MGWPVKLLFMSLLGLAACQQRSINGGSRRQRVPAGKSEVANFNCPEDFGYYPHPSDCTQYYVCVFGGALQESCTGGLVYSHELQTCDWPRNVVCNLSPAGSGVSTVRITDPRTQNTNSVRAATEPLTPSVGSFDVRFQNSLSSSQSPRDSQSFSVFDGSDKNRQPKFLRQESEPQQSFTRFPQQSFFSDTDVQESSSRPINVHPTTNRSPVFPWWKLQSLGHGDLQSLEEKARPVRETSLAQFYRSGRDVTHLNDSTPDFDFGLPFVSAATPRFGQESQPHILSRRQQHQPKTFGAAPASFRNPKPRVPNPRPDQGISRRQSRPKNNFFNQGFPPNHFQTQQFSRFPPNSFSNPFHPHFPPQTSPANPFGNFQSFSHFSDDLDTRPFTLNHKPIGQPPSQQHVFPPRHPPNTTPRPDFSQFDENLQVGHFTTRPQGQLHVFPPRLPHSNFAHRPQNDPFATHLSHPRFPPGGTPVEPFVIEEALAHTSPQPPLRVTPLDHSISALRPPPPPPPPQNSVPNFPHEFPSHSQFPKVDDSEFRPHSKFSSDDVPEFPPHSQFPNVDEPEFPPHSQFPNVDAPEFPPHSQFSNADDPEFPSHSQFSSVDDTEFPPRSQFPTSNHFSESQFPTHPSPPPRSPPSPPPSPAPPTTNPPPEPEDPSLPPSVPEFSSTSRTPFATSEFSFIPDVNEHPIPRTTVSPNPSFNSITEKPHRVSTHAKPTTPPQPPSPSTFPPFSNVRPTFSSFQNPGPSKSQSALKSPGPPPQIPGTARHPELSKLSASNSQTLDSKTPSSTLSQDNRQPSRPQTSFNAAVTSRPVARPAPTRAPAVEDAFYSDYNLTDADYLYYYDDLLYDYYDITPTTTTRAPVRRPSVTSAPARQPTSPNRGTAAPTRVPQRTIPATTGPISVDSVPKRNSRPTLKPVSVVAPTSPAIDIWKYPPQRAAPTRPQPPVDTKATKCDPKVCRLPDCYCGGKDVPDGIHPQDTPQMVLLTFDDSVNDLNKGLYTDLFENGRKNPNGCPIVSTMYVSHEWTDYSQVQNLYADGHEMASHSIQHSFGEQFSIKKWAKEIAGQREILAAYGGVKMEDVRGMRAPFLAVGGNKMFKMLYDQNFTYDSSMPVYENKPPSWPYTLDYKIFHDCMIPPCPTNSYPGVWEVPMVMWQDLNGGRCSMGDACTTPPDAEGVYKMLIKNFERHYTSNRAPFGLFYHAAWFTTPHHKEGFIAFLDTISAMDDVWLITNHQLLQWMRDPQPLSTVKNFAPFGCNFPDRKKCASTKVCNVWHKGGVRYMRTCQQCPEKYPWTGNTGVRSPLNDV
ncbi:nascent polypeptide-associated complex subunit alpha, muscle-specific form isoform X13 [Macrobrachium rosenbergii]|uniref:nascent polypeptide-associated complex subunit alpha, muscle-specific form isoform X13 n=1 Tax=Macrobrachium rosenbergii TaxID=79674 RepID=UPI0034D47142